MAVQVIVFTEYGFAAQKRRIARVTGCFLAIGSYRRSRLGGSAEQFFQAAEHDAIPQKKMPTEGGHFPDHTHGVAILARDGGF